MDIGGGGGIVQVDIGGGGGIVQVDIGGGGGIVQVDIGGGILSRWILAGGYCPGGYWRGDIDLEPFRTLICVFYLRIPNLTLKGTPY